MFTSQLDATMINTLVSNIAYLMHRDSFQTSQMLSDRCGLSVNSINRLRRGEMTAPTVNTLKALAEAFNVYWAWLVDRDLSRLHPNEVTPTAVDAWLSGRPQPGIFDKASARHALSDLLKFIEKS